MKNDVFHDIITTGPPKRSAASQTAPAKHKISEQEFQHKIEMAIARTSTNNGSLSIHMVPKKTGAYIYISFNVIAVPDI
ncbi:hypothetical protein HPB48_018314 [Haemaphysalis longicornis]|uniref:Uncharacterized protein n=1 Tax=Haemaphysalis longicornis TaxID=44386 RepID=A0A9J6GWI4_HAELO|nr:hypothetical protein HPB48_018314 [Haemaphysalis longicornis]